MQKYLQKNKLNVDQKFIMTLALNWDIRMIVMQVVVTHAHNKFDHYILYTFKSS